MSKRELCGGRGYSIELDQDKQIATIAHDHDHDH